MPKSFNLLDLATEVRLMILRELVGDSVVHIAVCVHHESAPITDKAGNTLYDLVTHVYIENTTALPETNGHGAKFTVLPYTNKVGRELPAQSYGCGTPAKYKQGLIEKSYAVLKTCRQIYEEASSVLYSTNIFSFQHARTLSHFLENRTLYHMSKISSIRISDGMLFTIHANGIWISDWDRYLMPLPFGHFSALRTIHLDLTGVHRRWPSHTNEKDIEVANDIFQEFLKLIEWLTLHRGLRVKQIPITYTLYTENSANGDGITSLKDLNQKHAKPREIQAAKMRDKTLKRIADFLAEPMTVRSSMRTGTASELNADLPKESTDDEKAEDNALPETDKSGKEEDDEEEEDGEEEEEVDTEDELDASYSVCASSTDSDLEALEEYDSESEDVQEVLMILARSRSEEEAKYGKDLHTAAANWTKMMGYEEGERDESRGPNEIEDRRMRTLGLGPS
jgi:hypothetical protein